MRSDECWQLATFAVLPVGEALLAYGRTRDQLTRRVAGLALNGVGALFAFLPQMLAWRCVYGHWLVEPVPQVAHHWLTPSLWTSSCPFYARTAAFCDSLW